MDAPSNADIAAAAVRTVSLDAARSVVFTDMGQAWFRHPCVDGDVGLLWLRVDSEHAVLSASPLSLRGAVTCDRCATSGWVEGGEWGPC